MRRFPPSVALPLATALIYLLALTLPYWLPSHRLAVRDELYQFTAREPWRGVAFYAALAALFGLYLAAYRHARRQVGNGAYTIVAIGLWTALFCLLLIPVLPLTSSDLYGYTFQGRIVAVLGKNPFVHRYGDFAADPLYHLVTFARLPASAGYGPLWIAVEAALGWLARDQLLFNLFLFKVLAAGLHLATTFLVYGVLGSLDPERRLAGTLFYAWNPLLLWELVGNAHNDAAVAALALLGFFALSRERGAWAIPSLAAAALIKPVAVLWLPPVGLWLVARVPGWGARLGRTVALAALALLPVAAAYAPFWQGMDTLQGLLVQSDIHGNSLPSLLIHLGGALWPQAGAGSATVQGVKLLTVVLFAPFYLWQLWFAWRAGRRGDLGDLVRACFDLILFYLLFVGLQFWPWYLAWLLVPAALLREADAGLRRPLTLALCVLAPLLYLPFGWQWAQAHLPRWFLALLAALPLLSLVVWLAVYAWQRHGSDPTSGQ